MTQLNSRVYAIKEEGENKYWKSNSCLCHNYQLHSYFQLFSALGALILFQFLPLPKSLC